MRRPFKRQEPGLPESTVTPGAFSEVPTPDADGVQRRAFGEFVSSRGELASYAFGWSTGGEAHEGRIGVGIGAGNPGGGTFHARFFLNDDGPAFGLVDDPFEDVPQGGPDLRAAEARTHEDLPFVWAVVDDVLDRDERAWWMRHWLLGTASTQTAEVFRREEPILLVTHDADDGMWQLIGSSDAGEDGRIGHLHHAVDEDHSLRFVLDLEAGERATREHPGDLWTRWDASA